MRKKLLFKLLAATFVFIAGIQTLHAENLIRKDTYVYSIKEKDTLRLDKYENSDGKVKPCVIFVFGGGFFSGARDVEFYVPYYHFLVNKGFSVVAIDYRLGFKNVQEQKDMKARDFLALFEKTIFMAVEDLFDATNFVLAHADEWNIDRNMIVTSGSSAGAITVLQGEYERCNRTELALRLPPDFSYAGVVAFAGAIYSNNGHLKWRNTPAPVQLFHGDADKNVPFDKVKFCKLGFFGSKYIAEKYSKNKFSYYFYIEENADHKIAADPMHVNLDEISSFLDKYVIQKQQLATNIDVKDMKQPKVKKNFKIKDYINTNFGL